MYNIKESTMIKVLIIENFVGPLCMNTLDTPTFLAP